MQTFGADFGAHGWSFHNGGMATLRRLFASGEIQIGGRRVPIAITWPVSITPKLICQSLIIFVSPDRRTVHRLKFTLSDAAWSWFEGRELDISMEVDGRSCAFSIPSLKFLSDQCGRTSSIAGTILIEPAPRSREEQLLDDVALTVQEVR